MPDIDAIAAEKKPLSPNEIVTAVANTVARYPIYSGLLADLRLVEDFTVKLLREIYGVDFSKRG